MKWILASEQLPEDKSKMYFIRNVNTKHGGMVYVQEMNSNENWEWLDESEPEGKEAVELVEKDDYISHLTFANDQYDKQIKELEQEVERLKGLIEKAHLRGWLDYPEEYDTQIGLDQSWEKFKTENHL